MQGQETRGQGQGPWKKEGKKEEKVKLKGGENCPRNGQSTASGLRNSMKGLKKQGKKGFPGPGAAECKEKKKGISKRGTSQEGTTTGGDGNSIRNQKGNSPLGFQMG